VDHIKVLVVHHAIAKFEDTNKLNMKRLND